MRSRSRILRWGGPKTAGTFAGVVIVQKARAIPPMGGLPRGAWLRLSAPPVTRIDGKPAYRRGKGGWQRTPHPQSGAKPLGYPPQTGLRT
jgi:hypothetical protein